MKFIIGENGWSYLERLSYRGVIGLFFEDTLSGILSYLIFGLVCIFAIIGIIATIKFLLFGFHRKPKSTYEIWQKQYNKNKRKKNQGGYLDLDAVAALFRRNAS